jgi:sugar/nucleoside kinase (ribokinase family)
VVVTADKPDAHKEVKVIDLKSQGLKVVDTNGAGDAFAGGFMGALVAGYSLDKAIEAGHIMGAMCVQQVRFRSYQKRMNGRLMALSRLVPSTNGTPRSRFWTS